MWLATSMISFGSNSSLGSADGALDLLDLPDVDLAAALDLELELLILTLNGGGCGDDGGVDANRDRLFSCAASTSGLSDSSLARVFTPRLTGEAIGSSGDGRSSSD